MNRRCAAFGFSLLGSLLFGAPAFAGDGAPPLQLKLASAPAAMGKPMRIATANTSSRRQPGSRQDRRLDAAEASLHERALQSMLAGGSAPDESTSTAIADSEAQFRFERQGSAFRDLSRGYKNLCATVSGKVWDDPQGRRIKFDIAGKPGVAVEIPLR